MTIGLSLDSNNGPRQEGQPYLQLADAVNRELPLSLPEGMLPATFLKYWASSDSILGQPLILTRNQTLLWHESPVRDTFGDPLNDPAALQVVRPLNHTIVSSDEVWVRTGVFASSWLSAHPSDTTPPQIQAYTLPQATTFEVGQTYSWQFTVSEPLLDLPTVTLNGRPVTVESLGQNPDIRFQSTYVLTTADIGTTLTVSYTMRDLAQNLAVVGHIYSAHVTAPVIVSASPAPGVYTNPISVTLTTDRPGSLRYTLDRSDPRTYLSQLYSGPISLSASTSLAVTVVDGTTASEVCHFEYSIQSTLSDPSIAPSIYPLFERDICVRGEASASNGARVKVRVNETEYWGAVQNQKYTVPVLSLMLGDSVAVAVEDTVVGKSLSPWVVARPSPRNDSYVLPEVAAYWGSQYPTSKPVEIYRGDSITLEFPLLYKGSPLKLPSGRLFFFVSSSRTSRNEIFQNTMYQLPSGNWGVNIAGEFQTTGSYWGEISIEQPNGSQTTLLGFPVYVIPDTRP